MTTFEFPALSPGTLAAIASVVEHQIAFTYRRRDGVEVLAELRGARILARAGIALDSTNAWGRHFGNTTGLDTAADSLLRQLVRDGLAARRCQCDQLPEHRFDNQLDGNCPHGIDLQCTGHFEADVPPVDGVYRLCGTCYVQVRPGVVTP